MEEAHQALHSEILQMATSLSRTPSEDTIHVLRFVEQVARRSIDSNCKACLFGSQATGLTLEESDIDIVIHAPSRHKRSKEAATKDEMQLQLRLLARELRRSEGRAGNTVWIDTMALHGRIPVIKCCTKFGKKCDVSFGTNAFEVNEATKQKLTEYPALRPILLVLKKILRAHGLIDASQGGLCSYALFHLALSFVCSRNGSAADAEEELGRLLVRLLNFYATQCDASFLPPRAIRARNAHQYTRARAHTSLTHACTRTHARTHAQRPTSRSSAGANARLRTRAHDKRHRYVGTLACTHPHKHAHTHKKHSHTHAHSQQPTAHIHINTHTHTDTTPFAWKSPPPALSTGNTAW